MKILFAGNFEVFQRWRKAQHISEIEEKSNGSKQLGEMSMCLCGIFQVFKRLEIGQIWSDGQLKLKDTVCPSIWLSVWCEYRNYTFTTQGCMKYKMESSEAYCQYNSSAVDTYAKDPRTHFRKSTC